MYIFCDGIFLRMFAGENKNVDDEDIIVTVDCNMFVMSRAVLHYLVKYPNMTAWVPKYYDTIEYQGPDGTFNQNLVSMKSKTWKDITGFDGKLENLVQQYKYVFQNPKQYTKFFFRDLKVVTNEHIWYSDQIITSHALISNKICNVPPTSGLWKFLQLEYDQDFNDENLCWHGIVGGYTDCNKNRKTKCGGNWWHFYPDQKYEEHLLKFQELMKH